MNSRYVKYYLDCVRGRVRETYKQRKREKERQTNKERERERKGATVRGVGRQKG